MPPVLMVDSATPEKIPHGPYRAAAVYVNGRYAWPQSQIARFADVIRISVLPDPSWAAHARVLDVERFDATPADAVAFIRERRRLGFDDATIYCSKAVVAAVQVACHGLRFRLWIADWDGHVHDDPDAWAVQYANLEAQGYDLSAVYGKRDFSRP
jgi:hypothetical protein